MSNQQILALCIVVFVLAFWKVSDGNLFLKEPMKEITASAVVAAIPTLILWLVLMLANNRF